MKMRRGLVQPRTPLLVLLASCAAAAADCEAEGCQVDGDKVSSGDGMDNDVLLLQTSIETSRREGGDVYDYIQQLVDERAANEALRMLEQGDVDVSAKTGLIAKQPDGDIELSTRTGLNAKRLDMNYMSSPDSSDHPSTQSAANLTGISANGVGDLKVLFSNMAVNGIIAGVCIFIFSILKIVTPMVYAFRDVDGKSDGFLGWIRASYRLKLDDVQAAAGLDQAMMIEFTYMALKILVAIGIPFLAILSPLDWVLGGNAAGEDHLSWMGLANVVQGSMVCWFHAPAVWWVILVSYFFMFRTVHRVLIPRRVDWLMSMARNTSTTVLVEKIPSDSQTKAGLKSYFDDFVFGKDVVREILPVKDTSDMMPLVAERAKLTASLHKNKPEKNEAENVRRLAEVEEELATQIARVEDDESLNLTSAFVTFNHRREATVAAKLLAPELEEDMEVRPAPACVDIVWEDLVKDPTAIAVRELIGDALIVGMYLVFLPAVVGLSVITDPDKLEEWFPFLDFSDSMKNFWEGYVTTAALSIVMSMVPFMLYLISSHFFLLRAQSTVQRFLQVFSFYFQVVFVLLVTAIGSSVIKTSQELIRTPTRIFSLLAESMPVSTHFYMNYFVLQSATHFVNLTRYMIFLKFLWFSRAYDSLESKEFAEPEDQADYGIGARSARWTLMLTIALVFSDLSPLMTVFGCIYFCVTRIIYGYLMVFAETKKPDTGGTVLITAMKHIQQCLFIFVILMTGVLLQRGATVVPGILAGIGFVPQFYFFSQFRKLRWEFLEFAEVKDYDERIDAGQVREQEQLGEGVAPATYKQPELTVVAPKRGNLGFFSRMRSFSSKK